MLLPRIKPFEEHADEYDAWFERHRNLYLSELAAVRELLTPGDARGLEIGVGSGRFAAALGIGYGVEPSPRMAEIARGRGIEVSMGTAEELPYADGCFDFLLMVTTVCFLDDMTTAFKEARRVLKDEGFLVVGFIDRDSFLGGLYQEKRSRSKFYGEATFVSVNDVVQSLRNSGFGRFTFRQTIFGGDDALYPVEEGCGRGSFVAIRAYPIMSV